MKGKVTSNDGLGVDVVKAVVHDEDLDGAERIEEVGVVVHVAAKAT